MLRILVMAFFFAVPSPTCEGAQVWYDNINLNDFAIQMNVTVDETAKKSARNDALVKMSSATLTLFESSVIECLEVPKELLYKAMRHMFEASGAFIGNDPDRYNKELVLYQRGIGEFRGYMLAIGVKIKDPDSDKVVILK